MNEYVLVKVSISGNELANYSFDSLPISIGRVPECQVVLDNPGISRLHANIERDGEALCLVDKSSGNGTCVNGKQIEAASVSGEDIVRIGKFTLNIRSSAVPGITDSPKMASTFIGQEEHEDRTIALSAEDRKKVLMQANALRAQKKPKKRPHPKYLPWIAVFAAGFGVGFLLSRLVG